MIARIWHGRTPRDKAEAYREFLDRTGIPDYRATEGNRGVWVLRRLEGEVAHFLLVSFWESEEAIRRFAGPEIEKAHYYPEDPQFLLELEPGVEHYDILVS